MVVQCVNFVRLLLTVQQRSFRSFGCDSWWNVRWFSPRFISDYLTLLQYVCLTSVIATALVSCHDVCWRRHRRQKVLPSVCCWTKWRLSRHPNANCPPIDNYIQRWPLTSCIVSDWLWRQFTWKSALGAEFVFSLDAYSLEFVYFHTIDDYLRKPPSIQQLYIGTFRAQCVIILCVLCYRQFLYI